MLGKPFLRRFLSEHTFPKSKILADVDREKPVSFGDADDWPIDRFTNQLTSAIEPSSVKIPIQLKVGHEPDRPNAADVQAKQQHERDTP